MKRLFMLIFVLLSLTAIAFANVAVLDLRDDNVYFRVGDNESNNLDLGTDYTIEAWIYIKGGARSTSERIFHSQMFQIYIPSGSGDGGSAIVRVDGSFLAGGGNISMTVPTDEWHHIALQGNSAGWTNNYLDGTAIANGGTSNVSAQDYFSIGSIGWSATYNFNGAIEEVRVSNVCRYARYSFSVSINDAPFTSDANTVLLYHFDDNAVPPTNASGMVFTATNYGIATDNYTAYNDPGFSNDIPLPITLTSFTATAKNGAVELAWETATETNNANFVIYRNGVAIAHVAGAGTTTEPHSYSYIDNTVIPGMTYTYVLADVDYANEENKYEAEAVTVTVANDIIEADFAVGAAYPNPFNPMTVVPVELSRNAMVKASLYDLTGHEIKTLVNTDFTAGTHELHIDGTGMTTGTYLLKIAVENVINVQRITLVK